MYKYSGVFGICFFAVSGCTSIVGGPKNSLEPDRDFSKIIIDETLDASRLKGLVQSGNISEAERNAVVQARLAEIDVLYFDYEARIFSELRQGNFAASFAQIAIGGAGSLASTEVSQNLSALSSVLAGSKAAFDKDILLDQTMQAYITQMRANRAAVKARILTNISNDHPGYTLQAAISDLEDYQSAGTLGAAVSALTQAAGDQEKIANVELDGAENVVFRQISAKVTPIGRNLATWLNQGTSATDKKARLAQVSSCYTPLPGPKPPSLVQFLPVSGNFPEIEAQVISCLKKNFGVTI